MKHKIYIGQNLKEYEEVERKIEINGEEFQIQEKREDIIELSSHEITSVSTLYPLREESNGAKFRNELRIEIEGKMQTNKNNSSEVVGLYEQEGKGEVIPIDNFELDINGHKFNDMMFQVRFGKAQINGGVLDRQEKTFKINDSEFFGTNALKLKKWTLDYLSNTDYRDMILAVIYNENDIRVTRYSNLYVVDYKEFFSVKEGVPRFKIILGQKYEEKKKEIKEEVKKPLPVEREKLEVETMLFFDINDNHVDFLFGKRKSLDIHEIELDRFKNKGLYDFIKSNETLYVGHKRNLTYLFEGEKRELTEKELTKIENLNVNKKYKVEELAKKDGYTLWANVLDEFLSQVLLDNFRNVLKLKLKNKLKKENEIVEEDYFIYKFEQERGKYLLIGMSKKIHYERNKYQNKAIQFHKKDLEKIEENDYLKKIFETTFPKLLLDSNFYYFKEKDMFFKKLRPRESLYHGIENEKYINISSEKNTTGVYEIVFNPNGEMVLDDKNLGTFNFYHPDKVNAHFLYDVLPYWIWGNSDNDENSLENRIIAKENLVKALVITPAVSIIDSIVLFEKLKKLF